MNSASMVSKDAPGATAAQTAPGPAPFPDMVWIPGGTFRMGSDKHYPEERPAHRVSVDGFWMDRAPVTNARFSRFVEATGHVTFAEILPKAEDYPGALPDQLFAGSLVFVKPDKPVDTRDFTNWWKWTRGAELATSVRRGQHDHRTRSASGGPRHVPRCRGVRAVGGEGITDRSGVGVRRARRPRRRRLCVGRGVRARTTATWPTPGRASSPGRARRGTATKAHRRSACFLRMAMACTT